MERSSLTRLNDFCKYVLLQKCAYLEQLLHNHAEFKIFDCKATLDHFWPKFQATFNVFCLPLEIRCAIW